MHHEMSCHNAVIFFTVKTIAEAAGRKEKCFLNFCPFSFFCLMNFESFRIFPGIYQ